MPGKTAVKQVPIKRPANDRMGNPLLLTENTLDDAESSIGPDDLDEEPLCSQMTTRSKAKKARLSQSTELE